MIFYTLSATLADGAGAGLFTGVLVAAVFACVVAHEFGHAFAAAGFGIPTHDITLLPIGGIARLARMPDKPLHELAIAVAGPAVNVVIAVVLAVVLLLLPSPASEGNAFAIMAFEMVESLVAANVILVLFNMLPAFPMDGGRVLRSLLAMRTTHLRATEIAARVGRWMALLFIAGAVVYGQLGLLLVGTFVFLAGTGELFEARRRAMAQSGSWLQGVWGNATPGTPSGEASSPRDFRPEYAPSSQPFSWGRSSQGDRGDVVDALDVRVLK